MVATEESIVRMLDELSEIDKGLKQAIEEDWPYSKVKALYDRREAIKADLKKDVPSVQLSSNAKEVIFKSTDGQEASKLTVKQPLMSDVFIKDMIENHRDEFIARAPQWCEIIKKGIAENPIEGVRLDDLKYLGEKKFEVTTTNTYKMGTAMLKSMEWAFDVHNVKYVEEGRTVLERMEAMYDGACRILNAL